MTGIQQDGLAFRVGGHRPGEALPRDQYVSLSLGVQVGTVDQLGAVSEDAARQRDLLKTRQAEQERLRAALADRQDEVESALGRYSYRFAAASPGEAFALPEHREALLVLEIDLTTRSVVVQGSALGQDALLSAVETAGYEAVS